MTYDDFMKILDDTKSMIISKELFKDLLDSQIPHRIASDEKKLIHEDGYRLGYATAQNEKPKRTGTWQLSDAKMQLYECNLCRYQVHDRMPFCSWCGAEMDNPVIGVRSRNKVKREYKVNT